MIVRDPWTSYVIARPSVMTLGQTPEQLERAAWWANQMHAAAQSIYQVRQTLEAAIARGDTQTASLAAESLRKLQAWFQRARYEYLTLGANQDALSSVDRVILTVGTTAEQAARWVAGVPGAALDAVQRAGEAMINAAGDLLDTAGNRVTGLSWKVIAPLAILGVILISTVTGLAKRAEQTRTYRKYVA